MNWSVSLQNIHVLWKKMKHKASIRKSLKLTVLLMFLSLFYSFTILLSCSTIKLVYISFFFFFCFLPQTKLKSAVQLQDLLDATRILVPRTRYHLKFNNSTDLTAKDMFCCALISFCLLAIYIIEFHKCGIQTFFITIINSLFDMHFANISFEAQKLHWFNCQRWVPLCFNIVLPFSDIHYRIS